MLLTERALISCADRNSKSTLPMWEAMGCEIFMMKLHIHALVLIVRYSFLDL